MRKISSCSSFFLFLVSQLLVILLCVSVPDVNAACDRFESMSVEFVKRRNNGSMKGIAFIKDPDGYWVEIFAPVDLKNVILEHT